MALKELAEPPDFPGADGNHEFVVGGGFHGVGEANQDGPGVNSQLWERDGGHGRKSWSVCRRVYRPAAERLQGFGEMDWRRGRGELASRP